MIQKKKNETETKRNWRENANVILCKFILVLGAVIFAVFSYQSMISTYDIWSSIDENMILLPDSAWKNIVFCAAALCVIMLLGRLILGRREEAEKPENMQKVERRLRILLFLVCALYLIASIVWVTISHSHPIFDQASVVDGVEKILNGIYDRFNPEGYFGMMPHQMGLVFVIEMLFRVFGNGNFISYQYFNAVCMPILVFSGYKLVRELFPSARVGLYYLLMMCVCFQLFYYVPFIYGEVGSTAFILLAAWLVMKYLHQEKWRDIIFSALALGFATMLRKNSVIMLIAVIIVLLLDMIRRKKPQFLIAAAIMVAATMLMQVGVQTYYCRMTGLEKLHGGIPSMAYITMGMQDIWPGPGWYNNYNKACYATAGLDTEAATELAKQDLATRLAELKADKSYALGFFGRKIITQWNEPAFECIWMNNKQFDVTPVPGTLVFSALFGTVSVLTSQFMNYYQFTIYLLFALAMVILLFRKQKVTDLLPVIYVLGGFFFCILWEAKSRYMLPYYIFLFPYAAYGIYLLQEQYEKLGAKYVMRLKCILEDGNWQKQAKSDESQESEERQEQEGRQEPEERQEPEDTENQRKKE